MMSLSSNEVNKNSRRTIIHATIVFGISMFLHAVSMALVGASLPRKLTPILMNLSATLIYDTTLLIDLARGYIPIVYTLQDVLIIGVAPWLIASILSAHTSNTTTEAIRGGFYGVILSVFVLFYTWVVIGGFQLTGLLLSMHLFIGLFTSILLVIIGTLFGRKLNPWIKKILNNGLS